MLKKLYNEKYLQILILAFISITFILLLWKNPFSERNLIPNLEPFPDSIHYLNPALNLARGKGLHIEREGRAARANVPILYSIILTPGFLINHDVRFFYFTNVVLALAGLVFFYKFLKLISPNSYIVLLTVFLYVTNYFIFWFPNLPMAENATLPIFLIALYLLAVKATIKKSVFAALIGVLFFMAKYASLVLTLTFFFLYFIKLLADIYPAIKSSKFSLKIEKEKLIIPTVFILSAFISFGSFFITEYVFKGNNILASMFSLVAPIFIKQTPEALEGAVAAPASTWFSLNYFPQNIGLYWGAITGNSMRFLWDFTPLVPKYIAIPALVGLFVGLLTKGYRYISFSLLLLIATPILFIATFYSADARYIYTALPSLLAGFAIVCSLIYDALKKEKLTKLFYILLVGFFVFYSITNFSRLKYQISLNLRHTETPWYYVSVKSVDNYLTSIPEKEKQPILLIAVPPYYVDFYKTGKYKIMPVSQEQEFFKDQYTVWGPADYSNFPKLYKQYYEQGHDLYLTNAGLGSVNYLHRDYNLLKDNFNLETVFKGCHGTCDIYKLTPKDDDSI